MIFEGSRYEHSDVVRVVATDGKARPTVIAEEPVDQSIQYAFYTVRLGDRVDLLADQFFGDPELWWKIADANPRRLFWDYLPEGTTLRIPSGRVSG
jgi:hypothetical protein